MARAIRGMVAAAALAVAAALFFAVAERPARPPGTVDDLAGLRQRDDLNVILLLVDTLRADHLGTYGYGRDTSPTIDALTAEGVRFARVRAQSSWTKASMASLWMGLGPARTGVLRAQHALPEAATLPAEILRAAGLRTLGIWRNGWVANNFGFHQGFDVYYRPRPAPGDRAMQRGNPSAFALPGTDYDATRAALDFLRAYQNERFFLYVHYMDVHQYVYERDSALFGTDYVAAYDNAIHWTDRNVGMLVDELRQLDLLRRTVIVLASDHGEAFREHGREGHARDLYAEVTETPLLLWLPFRLEPGLVVEEPVANVDLWPTLLDLLGLDPLPGADGRSLLPLIRAAAGDGEGAPPATASPRLRYAHLDRTWGRPETPPDPLVSVSRGRHRLFYTPRSPGDAELYDLVADPDEQQELAADHPALVAELGAAAQAYLDAPPPAWGGPEERTLDELHLQQLRALGYVVGGQAPAALDARARRRAAPDTPD